MRVGTPARIAMGPVGAVTLIAEPDDVRHVLVERARDYPRGAAIDLVRPMLGDGLPLADGEVWLRHRRTMQPAFGRARLEAMVPIVARRAGALADSLVAGDRFRAHDTFMGLTLGITVETMFGASLPDDPTDLASALAAIERYVGRYSLLPFVVPLGLPTPDNRAFRRAIATLDALVAGLVAQGRARTTPAADLLGALLAARDPETDAPLTDREIRDEALNIVYAGHETTANALTWATALLSDHPEVLGRVRAEARDVLGDRLPEPADVDRLVVTTAVVRETLRLYPPAWIFARTAAVDDVIGGRAVPAGSVVMVSPWVTHRLPAWWDEPGRFDPDRFLRDPSLAAPAVRPLRYYPFGAGGHQCIGNHLALMEATVILAAIARRAELRVDRPEAARARPGATLGVGGGLPVTVVAAA